MAVAAQSGANVGRGPGGEPRRRRWLLWQPVRTEEEQAAGYFAERDKVQAVRVLAIAQVVLALFSAGPALSHLNLATAPAWAKVLLVAAGFQIAYAVWMALLADWSTVWVTMAVWAVTAAGYGLFWTVITFTAIGEPIELLDIDPVRGKAGGWCLAMLIFSGIMTGICGRLAARWRRLLALRSH